MMTRCRAVVDDANIASSALAQIESSIYQKYDEKTLSAEIIDMRKLVVDELGSKQGTYDIKRGVGGIMDIDFLTHYLQLMHGYEDTSLRTSSTRTALRKISEAGKIDNEVSQFLLEAYDYLKTIESHIRVFDMKSISTFPKDIAKSVGLVRSMNYRDDNIENAAGQFMDDYRNMAQQTRNIFNETFSLS